MKYVLLYATLLAAFIPTWAQQTVGVLQYKVSIPKLARAGAVSCPALPGGTPHEAEYCWSTPAGTTTLYQAVGTCPASGIGSLTYSQVSTQTALTGTYIYTGVSAATTYCAYATATVGSSVSPPSNTVQFTIPVFAPTALTCTPSTTSAACTWTASADGGTVTVLDSPLACGATGQTFSTVASGVAAGGPYTLTGLTASTYCVELTATLGGVTSPPSGTFQFSTSVASPAIAVQVR